jgi:hypothetical protein
MASRTPKRKKAQRLLPGELPDPPVRPDADLRDVPIPVDAFIKLAMSEFGVTREEASRMVHECLARRHGAKGNA